MHLSDAQSDLADKLIRLTEDMTKLERLAAIAEANGRGDRLRNVRKELARKSEARDMVQERLRAIV